MLPNALRKRVSRQMDLALLGRSQLIPRHRAALRPVFRDDILELQELFDKDLKVIRGLLEVLDEHEDVVSVWSNLKL